MLSRVDKSILGANNDPLFNTHEFLTVVTALSFPDLMISTTSEYKVLPPLNYSSDCAKSGRKHCCQHGWTANINLYPLSRIFSPGSGDD